MLSREWRCCKSDSNMDNFKDHPWKKLKQFVAPTSIEQTETVCKRFIMKNTNKSTNWAVKMFEQWRVKRNEAASGDSKPCPDNLLEMPCTE